MSSPGAASPAAVPVPSARAEASRKNGAKSRGPKTPEGKARAAQNALKHGLRAEKYVVLPDEAGEEFAELEAALLEELAPVGALQAVLARRVAVAAWRLARADRIEVELFAERSWGPDATPGLALIRDGNGTRSFETLLRYRGAAMAEFWRALRTLKALQAERAAETGVALAALPARPAAGPPLAQRPQPDEPERAAGPRLENVPSELPFRSHAARARRPWLPKEPETGPARHAGSAPASRTNPKPHPNSTRPKEGENRPSPRLPEGRTNPSTVEVGAGQNAPAGIAAADASRRALQRHQNDAVGAALVDQQVAVPGRPHVPDDAGMDAPDGIGQLWNVSLVGPTTHMTARPVIGWRGRAAEARRRPPV